MRRRLGAFVAVLFALSFLVVPLASSAPPVAAQSVSCANYDAWVWAQSVFESNKSQYAALDVDGDGIACPDLTIHGFAPVSWTKSIPKDAVPAQATSDVDDDTFHVTINGVDEAISLADLNMPATASGTTAAQCGGQEAADFLQFILSYAPNGTVYLEYAKTQRDAANDRLAYVWYQLDGQTYLVNEAMVRTGWAEPTIYNPDNKYGKQLDAAEQFSAEHVLGVRLGCGAFGRPAGSGPSQAQLKKAIAAQPNQGQFAAFTGGQPGQDAGANTGAQAPTDQNTPDSGTSVGNGGCSYRNVDGVQVSCPVPAPAPPAGATAQCNDGTYSFSQHRRGTCSGHGGVSQWLADIPA